MSLRKSDIHPCFVLCSGQICDLLRRGKENATVDIVRLGLKVPPCLLRLGTGGEGQGRAHQLSRRIGDDELDGKATVRKLGDRGGDIRLTLGKRKILCHSV